MKARIIDQPATVYSGPDQGSMPVTQAGVGAVVDLGAAKKDDGRAWVSIVLSDGRRGYVPGSTRVSFLKCATLLQNDVSAYSQPSTSSPVAARYAKAATLYLGEKVNQDGKSWVRVIDSTGTEGFIDGQTRIKMVPVATKAVGKKNMLFGGLWCVGGTVVTVATYAAASSGGGSYFVAWGGIVFGGIQFFKGLYQVLTAPV